MNMILKSAIVLCLCAPSAAYAKQLAGEDFSKACGTGTKTCHLVSNDRGATWVGPFCGPCTTASAAGVDPASSRAGENSGVITILSANGSRTFAPGGKLPRLMGGDQVSVGSGLSGNVIFEIQGSDLQKVAAGPGAVFRLKYLNADEGWVLESISMQINVRTKDGVTALTPGRAIRLTNIRANAAAGLRDNVYLPTVTSTLLDSSGRITDSRPTSSEILVSGRVVQPGPATSATSTPGSLALPAIANSVTSTAMLTGKVTNDREKMAPAAPDGGEMKPAIFVGGSQPVIVNDTADKGGADAKPAIFDRWGEQGGEEGKKSISIDIKDYNLEAKAALQELADAYSAKRRTAFMRLVSPDFSGDVSTFEDALVKDFRTYSSVNLSLTPDRVVVQGDMASVEFHYNLTVVNEQGVNKTFSGRSNYTFRREEGKVRLYKMDKPVIFGNSLPASENPMDAGQNSLSAAGSAAPGVQDTIRGSAEITAATPGGAGGPGAPGSGFSFNTQSATLPADASTDIFVDPSNKIWASRGGTIVTIGACNLESVASAPGTITGTSAAAAAGECYAVKTAAGKYAVLRVTWIPSIAAHDLGFTYKFQPGGSNAF